MSSLIAKEKLHFTVNSEAVSNSDFKHWKKIALTCLNEQPDVVEMLDRFYKQIHICFFYESSEKKVVENRKQVFPGSTTTQPPPAPACSIGYRSIALIEVFLKHFGESEQKITSTEDIDGDIKILFFEEICHLVRAQGKEFPIPFSYRQLQSKYDSGDKTLSYYGKTILYKLLHDREHYTVYSMMLFCYPKQWVKGYADIYLSYLPEDERVEYEGWKNDSSIPPIMANTYAVVCYLTIANWLLLFNKAYKENLSEECVKLLDYATQTFKKHYEATRELIGKEMGQTTLSLLDSMDDSVYETSEGFFKDVLMLWQQLNLI